MNLNTPAVRRPHELDDGFSEWLQKEIDRAAKPAYQPRPKWTLVEGIVRVPSGVLHAHKTIRLRSGVQVWGESQASTGIVSHLRDNTALFETSRDDEPYALKLGHLHAISANKFEGQFFRGFNANRNCALHDLFIEMFDGSIFSEDCFTTAFRDIGIYMCRRGFHGSNLTNGRVDSVKVENCAEHGFILSKSAFNTVTGTEVSGLVCQGNGFSGVRLDGLDQVHFTSLFLEGNDRTAMRATKTSDRYGQLSMVADRSSHFKRNGNIAINGIFITPGHSKDAARTAVNAENVENLHIAGGMIRTFSGRFKKAFVLGKGVTVADLVGLTLEGFEEENLFTYDPKQTHLTTRNLVVSSPGGQPFKRLDDQPLPPPPPKTTMQKAIDRFKAMRSRMVV